MYRVYATLNTEHSTLNTMEIRTYTKQELASLYSPGTTDRSALRTLYNWIRLNTELRNELCATHYSKWSKSFTPRQVRLIVKYLGEP